jgi:hypothetical protein
MRTGEVKRETRASRNSLFPIQDFRFCVILVVKK